MSALHAGSDLQAIPAGAVDDMLFEMGIRSAAGEAEEADLVAAHKWFNLSAVKGNPEGARYRQEVAGLLTAAEMARAQREAREWLRSH